MVEFGEGIEPISIIRQLLHVFGKQNSIDTGMLMRDRYEKHYGIHDHDLDRDDPLALVTLRPAEDNSTSSRLYGRMTDFAKKKIGTYWNMSLTEFLSLPRDMVEHILKTTDELEKNNNVLANKVSAEVTEAMGIKR